MREGRTTGSETPHRSLRDGMGCLLWAGQVPKGEDGSQLCSGGFLRSAAPGAPRSIT